MFPTRVILQTIWEQSHPKRDGLSFGYYKGYVAENLGTNPTKKGKIDIWILQEWYYRQIGNKANQKGRYWHLDTTRVILKTIREHSQPKSKGLTFGYYKNDANDKLE